MFRKVIRCIPLIVLSIIATSGHAQSTGTFSSEQLRADFEALYTGLQGAHYDLYAHRPEQEYEALYAKTHARLDKPLELQQARIAFQEFAAFGNVAHSRIDFDQQPYRAYREAGGKVFPLYFRIVDGVSYVSENLSGNAGLLPGVEVVAINDIEMKTLLAKLSRYLSADIPYIAHSLLEFQLPMYLWQDLGALEEFDVTYLDGSGVAKKVKIPAASYEQMREQRASIEPAFELDATAREAKVLGDGVAYLRPGPFYNIENLENPWDNTAFVRFIDDAFERFIEADANSLVIDLRQNPGGDNSFSDPMIAWFATKPFRFASRFLVRSSEHARAANQARLDTNPGSVSGASGFYAGKYASVPYGETFEYPIPLVQPRSGERFTGKVYALIDRHSFSNAVTVAALVQDYEFGVIAGEPTSDMATTYGAMETFTLPNTGIVVGFPKAHIIRPSGETRTAGVTPDKSIPSPIVPMPTDVMLEELLRHISP